MMLTWSTSVSIFQLVVLLWTVLFLYPTRSFLSTNHRLAPPFRHFRNSCKSTNSRYHSISHSFLNAISDENEFDRFLYSKLSECDTLIPYELSSEYSTKTALLGKQTVEYSCDAFTGTNVFQYLRMVKLVGGNYTILNLMGLPRYDKKSPILGIDLVSLPGYTVAAIDLQPGHPLHRHGDFHYSSSLSAIHKKYSELLPISSTNTLPAELKPYFSPYVLFARIPAANHSMYESTIRDAVIDYIDAYKQLVLAEALDKQPFSNEHTHSVSTNVRKLLIRDYLNYRVEKDPAKNLLTAAFGREWTAYALRHVFFPFKSSLQRSIPLISTRAGESIPIRKRPVYLVSSSQKKVDEVNLILGDSHKFELIHVTLPELVEMQGDSLTVAIDKCKRAAQMLNAPVITEDTGLSLSAMSPHDLPGPYIKWFYTSLGSEKFARMVLGYSKDASAAATCTVCFATGPEDEAIEGFVGVTNGKIVHPTVTKTSADEVMGWDDIFIPDGYTETYADLSADEKIKISHRSKAFLQLAAYLDNLID